MDDSAWIDPMSNVELSKKKNAKQSVIITNKTLMKLISSTLDSIRFSCVS